MPLTLLIVDPDCSAYDALRPNIEAHFAIQMAQNGLDALALLEQTQPDILLIDGNLADQTAYAICQRYKNNNPNGQILFIASTEKADYVAAYGAGADDFISKPFCNDELQQKLLLFQRSIEETQQLRSSVQAATVTAMQAISNSAELGTVISFFKRASLAPDEASLLKALVQTTAKFNVQVAAQIHQQNTLHTLNSQGRCSPLEEHMLQTLAQDPQRIYEMGKRLVINFPRIILQVKDMPVNQPDLCGRLRDHIAILVEAAETRLDGILNETQIRAQQQLTLNAISLIQSSIQKLENEYRHQASSSMLLFSELQDQFEHKMVYLGLTDSQEGALLDMIAHSLAAATQIYDQGLSLDDEFSHVIATLIYLTQQSPQAVIAAAPEPAEPSDDIMLF
ncbi:response regulator transcription factor [Deefgea piscis]|uniref:response regulator transcription factor n=1 Tax=Deefgea piscis TaxID=2739061 RepID=UPI001C7F79C8|nr:response regulator [Deefgea piscis]QZA82422.1 response regulator [Deefgea piscis]